MRSDVRMLCRFEDWQYTAPKEEDKNALRQHLERHWRGFVQLQHVAAMLEADAAVREAAAAQQAPPADKVQAVLQQAGHFPWLPTQAAQVPVR